LNIVIIGGRKLASLTFRVNRSTSWVHQINDFLCHNISTMVDTWSILKMFFIKF
ncbi:unnamed protein product, partial [Tenebrio molitor]